MGRGYLKAILSLGAPVAAISPRGFLHDPSFPLPEGLAEVSLAGARAAPPPEVGLGFLHPPRLGRLIGKRKGNLFVWESDLLPPGWAGMLDRGADVVVVPSAFTRDALVASGFPAGKAVVVPYGYDEEALVAVLRAAAQGGSAEGSSGSGAAAQGASAEGASGMHRPFTFLAVVSPHRRKGVRELLAAYRLAFKAADDVLLRVKSTYDPAATRRRFPFEIGSWQEALREHGLTDPGAPRVELDLRILDDAAAMTLYREADLLVAPSWGESFGLAILEAMASGKPVIATGWGGHMGFFPPGPDALPYRFAEAGDALYEPAPGAHVAIPHVDALAGRMRWHREHPGESRASGAGNVRRVEGLTWRNGARELLRQCLGEPHLGEP